MGLISLRSLWVWRRHNLLIRWNPLKRTSWLKKKKRHHYHCIIPLKVSAIDNVEGFWTLMEERRHYLKKMIFMYEIYQFTLSSSFSCHIPNTTSLSNILSAKILLTSKILNCSYLGFQFSISDSNGRIIEKSKQNEE